MDLCFSENRLLKIKFAVSLCFLCRAWIFILSRGVIFTNIFIYCIPNQKLSVWVASLLTIFYIFRTHFWQLYNTLSETKNLRVYVIFVNIFYLLKNILFQKRSWYHYSITYLKDLQIGMYWVNDLANDWFLRPEETNQMQVCWLKALHYRNMLAKYFWF